MVNSEDIFTPQLLDNIKFGFISTGVLGVVIVVLILAWLSTGLPPLNYYVWLVQLQTLPARRIIQVFTMNDESSNGLLDTALNETPSQLVAEELNRNNPNSLSESGEEPSNQTTVVIIQPPSSITNRNNTAPSAMPSATVQSSSSRVESNQQQQSSLSTPSGDMTTGNYRFELPTESGEDINQIHRFLRANTDNAIATAATIALYNRRMNEQAANPNNRLLVSSVSMSIESEENHPTQNIMISYDNLQPVASNHEETTSTVHTNTSDSDSFTDGESSTASSNSTTTSTGSHTNQDSMTTDEEELELAQSSSSNPKGVTATTSPQTESDMTIKLKFLDDTQRLVKTWLSTTVGDFKRNNFSETLTTGKVVRLIYQGQLLRDDSRSLSSYGIHDQCVVHCHVGNRPYVQAGPATHRGADDSNQNSGSQRQNDSTNATTFGARILSTGISWADILLLAVWNVLFSVYNWAQAVDNNNNNTPATEDNPAPPQWRRRALEGVRRALRLVLNCLFDPTMRPTANADDPFGNRFNAGALIGLLFALKFLTMWLFVLYFPQFSNPSTIVLLTILTVVMGSYFSSIDKWVEREQPICSRSTTITRLFI